MSLISLTACGGVKASSPASAANAEDINVGTTDKVVSLDPAGAFEWGSNALAYQMYPTLFTQRYNDKTLSPSIASDNGSWNADGTQFTVHLKPNLRFANGHELTASDVKFSIDRVIGIDSPNGPISLFQNITGVDAPASDTVTFKVSVPHDVTLKRVLGTAGASIVDDQSFPADHLANDQEVVRSNGFAGAYRLTQYVQNDHAVFERNSVYAGLNAAQNHQVTVTYFADSSNLKLAVQQGQVDVAYRSLLPADITSLRKDGNVRVIIGAGGEMRYLVFNFHTQPYGSARKDADPTKAVAVRRAVADLVDRKALSDNVYHGTFAPLYAFYASNQPGSEPTLRSAYGDGKGGPSVNKARQVLTEDGVTTPIDLNIEYNTDHYGASSTDEYAAIASQLEEGGLFRVTVQQAQWSQYSKERVVRDGSDDRQDGSYPAYQLGWFPDYSDPANYLVSFFGPESYVSNGYSNTQIHELLDRQAGQLEESQRLETLRDIQRLATDDVSILPLLQGSQVAVTGRNVHGIVLDSSYVLRFSSITKGGGN
ncbi:peptide ABC transporter substrate-binding protein [Bifidobacterium callitrichos]|uniref:Peptide ABC transporter substrate-binding protein n=1 Tax=Bifidobacterium callitrichos TaxID=762209 RepID=A0A2T3G9G1_9BIFI|nr:ABC transporter substrate-binding protein [Bifidobacterium callitrichos]PST46099.1 peptide ABC transporter substrate-binding protein [Bifidobacterium callitrichos]